MRPLDEPLPTHENALAVIPEYRLTNRGLVDVEAFECVDVVAD